MDLSSGYHQLRIHPDDCYKIAFITLGGLDEWRVLPFRLANTSVAFMRTINQILDKHHKYSVVYLDDIMVCFWTRWEHIKYIDDVLASFRVARLYLNKKM
jgi:hypothetical protein